MTNHEKQPTREFEIGQLLSEARARATAMRDKFGPHDSAEFACCRIMEEAGELAQAATAMSKGRHENRKPRIREEAIDTIAMVLRLVEEYPYGRTAAPIDVGEPRPFEPSPPLETYTCECGTEVTRRIENTPMLCLECESEANEQ